MNNQNFTQSDKGVPSSANWNPTNPLRRRHQNVAEINPICTPVKYYKRTRARNRRVSHMNVERGLVHHHSHIEQSDGAFLVRA